MDFFHCNSCYIQPGSQNKAFWLTSCSHSFCEDCANTSDSVCRICHKNCKYLALASDMPDDVKGYFSDAIKDLKKILKVLLIQNKQCKIYMEEYIPKVEAKYFAAKLTIEKKKVAIETAGITLDEKKSEIESLKKIIKKLESELQDIKKQFCTLTQHSVRAPPETPRRYAFAQEIMTPPRSGGHISSRLSSQSRQGNSTFLSPSISSPLQDMKRLTGMDLLLKTKDLRESPRQNIVRPTSCSQNILRSPTCSQNILRSPTCSQNILRTPTNQTFKMTINSSPESSEDERWSSSRRSVPLITKQSQHHQQTSNKMRGRFF